MCEDAWKTINSLDIISLIFHGKEYISFILPSSTIQLYTILTQVYKIHSYIDRRRISMHYSNKSPCKISSSYFYGMVVRKLGFVSTTTWHDEKLGKIVWDYYAEMENILEALYCTQRTYWT